MKTAVAALMRIRAFGALRYPQYRLLSYVQIFSNVGTWMEEVTRGWLIYQLTDSVFQLGLVRGVQLLPLMLLSPLAGSAADRYSRKTLLLVAQGASVTVFAVMAVLILVFLGAFAVESNRGKTSDAAKTRGGTRAYLRDVASLLHNRGLMLIACSGMFRVATQSGLLTFLPVYLAYELGYSSWAVGMAMMMLQATGFIAGPIGGHISDVVGRKKVVMASMAGTACVILGIIFAGKTPVFILIVALLGFFLYATRAVFQAWTLEQTPPHLAATGIGINFSMQGLGAAFAPFMFGYIADHYSIYTAFYFLAGLVVIANILICFMPGMSNRPAHASGNTP